MQQRTAFLPDGTGYRLSGQGAPVFLIHGFGEDGNIWKEQVNALQHHFRCIVPDMPGTGISAPAFDTLEEHSLEQLGERIRGIAEKEALGTFTLLGHSMGGYITLAFAEKYPRLLNGYGLIHSTAFADNEEKINTRRRSIQFIREQGAPAFLGQMIPNLYGQLYKKEHHAEIQEHISSTKAEPEVLIAYYEMMIKRPDRTDVLKTCEKPVLFVMGTEDKTVNLADSLRQCHMPSECHVHILGTSGHMGMKEEPGKTIKAMTDFLVHLNEN